MKNGNSGAENTHRLSLTPWCGVDTIANGTCSTRDGEVSPSGVFREDGCKISLAVNHLMNRVAFPSQT